MDFLQETPSTGWLDAVVSALRKAKEVGTKLPVFEPGSMLSKALDGPTLGGLVSEGGLHELSNWSHGNLPFEMQPGTGIPRIRSDVQGSRGSDVIDAAGMLPFGTAGSAVSHAGPTAKAMLLGTNLADPKVVELLRKLRLGATENEAWQDTGRAIVPTQPSAIRANLDAPHNLSFVREVSDAGLKPNKNMQYTPTEKAQVVASLDPLQQQGAAIRASNTDLFLPGRHYLSDLIEHPELFAEHPDLKNIRVHVDPKSTNRGMYSPSTRGILLGVDSLLTSPSEGAISTLMHELMHDQQRMFGMPRGGGTKQFELTAPERDKLYNLYADLAKLYNVDQTMLYNLYNMTKERTSPYKLYQNLLGEQQARAVQKRLRMLDAIRAEISPTMSYDNLESALNPDYATRIINALRNSAP